MEMELSKKYFTRSQKVSPGGVHSPVRSFRGVGGEPLFFKSAQGAYIESVDGKRYVDFCQSFGPNILGHRDLEIESKVQKVFSEAWCMGACEPYSLELAEWITQEIPWVEKIRFVCSGTEAVMSALRVARAATGRKKILKFDGCYHGHTDSMLVKSGSGLAGLASSDSAGVPEEIAQLTLVAPLNDEASVQRIFAEHGDDIAAVIFEPLPANYGLLIQKEEFLKNVVQLARKNQSLIIFDEVISGFRVAMGGMAEVLDIKPDLVTYGKIIGGGFPVGAYAGKAEFMNLVAPSGAVYQAGTLAAHPVGMVAGLETLKKMKALNIHKTLNERTTRFCNDLKSALQAESYPVSINQMGSLFWFYYGNQQPYRLEEIHPEQKEYFKKLFHHLLDDGVYLPPSGYEVAFMSLAHNENLLNEVKEKIIKAHKKI